MTRCSKAGRGLLFAGLMSVLASAACDAPRDSIIVDEGMVTVENQTAREWRKVRVTVNDHFSGGVDVAAARRPPERAAQPVSDRPRAEVRPRPAERFQSGSHGNRT